MRNPEIWSPYLILHIRPVHVFHRVAESRAIDNVGPSTTTLGWVGGVIGAAHGASLHMVGAWRCAKSGEGGFSTRDLVE